MISLLFVVDLFFQSFCLWFYFLFEHIWNWLCLHSLFPSPVFWILYFRNIFSRHSAFHSVSSIYFYFQGYYIHPHYNTIWKYWFHLVFILWIFYHVFQKISNLVFFLQFKFVFMIFIVGYIQRKQHFMLKIILCSHLGTFSQI